MCEEVKNAHTEFLVKRLSIRQGRYTATKTEIQSLFIQQHTKLILVFEKILANTTIIRDTKKRYNTVLFSTLKKFDFLTKICEIRNKRCSAKSFP